MLYRLLKPLVFRLDPERAHDLATALLANTARIPGGLAILGQLFAFRNPILATRAFGLVLPNPIGLAAGFDKRAVLVEPLTAMGFGHVEIGTVTPRPQPGNPKPRMFRLPEDAALINRLGFNSPGMLEVAQQLRSVRRRNSQPVIGVNIGKNRDTALEQASADYLAAVAALAPFADYIAVNISSPNTPGLRQLHERSALEGLVAAIAKANQQLAQPRPLLLKISPDESDLQIETVVGVGLAAGFSGFIATNTSIARPGLASPLANETGGLSGRPLAARSLAVTQQVTRLCQNEAIVISVGGIATGSDAYARIRAGASLVQCYTALVYQGPGVAGQIARELAVCLKRDGFRSVAEAVAG